MTPIDLHSQWHRALVQESEKFQRESQAVLSDLQAMRDGISTVWAEEDIRKIVESCMPSLTAERPSARDHYTIGRLEGEAVHHEQQIKFWAQNFQQAKDRADALEGQLTTTRRLLDEASRRAASLAFQSTVNSRTHIRDVALGAVVAVAVSAVCVGGLLSFLAL